MMHMYPPELLGPHASSTARLTPQAASQQSAMMSLQGFPPPPSLANQSAMMSTGLPPQASNPGNLYPALMVKL